MATTSLALGLGSSSSSGSTMFSTIMPILASATVAIGLQEYQARFFWALIAGFITSFLLGFGMGANDVANAFGTSVGSKVLTLRKANIMATIMETLGAVLVGYNVVDTVRKSIVELNLYEDTPAQLLVGQIAILGGCACWMLLASIFRLPVSSSHSIVGSTIGFTLLMRGNAGIHWSMVGTIAVSWVISPILSGLVSSCIYMIVDFAVLRRSNPLKCGLRIMPIFYFFCFAFYTFMVVFEGSRVLHLEVIPFWMALVISASVGMVAALVYLFVLRPRLIKWVKTPPKPVENPQQTQTQQTKHPGNTEIDMATLPPSWTVSTLPDLASENKDRSQPFELSPMGFVRWFIPRRDRKEDQQTLRLFGVIQVVTGCFAGFSHGASDVSHTIAPLVALLDIYHTGNVYQETDTPLWMMFYGVSGTCLGFWALGHRVMQTIGKNITEINPCNGFAIELGMAITVLLASKIGIPISSTHCIVGSVMFVGLIKAGEGVDWRVLINVALSWLVTLPVSALFSAIIMFVLNHTLL